MAININGGCFCGQVRYRITLDSLAQASSSLCHCRNCKKAYGGDFFVAVKVPSNTFEYVQGKAKVHKMDNGSGILVVREFCDTCGSNIVEYSERTEEYRFITLGTLDDPTIIKPAGEVFTKDRLSWMHPLPDTYQKETDD